jgi:hypothetical protein
MVEHSDNGHNFWEERLEETTGEAFGWSGKLVGGEVNHGNNK